MTQVTDRERRAYKRKLNEIAKRHNRLEESTVRQSIVLLRDLRSRIAGLLTEHENFEQYRLRELQDNINNMIAQYEGQLVQLMSQTVKDSHALGGQFAVEPLEAAGIKNLFFRPSQAQVNTLLDYNAAMIRSVPADAVRKIDTQIRIAALGEGSTFQAMKNITRIMGLPKKASDPTKGIAYEAERIFRTETNRAFNLANHSQQQANLEIIPGLMKQWVATGDSRTRLEHLKAHGQTVPVDKKFVVWGEEMDYPGDPKASAKNTIDCRCRSVEVLPEFADMETPLDAKIEKERARRDEQKPGIGEPRVAENMYEKIQKDERLIIDLTHEVAGVYNSDGDLLFAQEGTKDQVEFSTLQVGKMKGGILTHNHPGGSSFSVQDYRMLVKGELAEIRAVGRQIYTTGEGATVSKVYQYSLKANAEARKDIGFFMHRADKLDEELKGVFMPKVRSGLMTATEANYNHRHTFWQTISGELQGSFPGAKITYARVEL